MAIRNGGGTIKRRHATNYIHEEVQKRLEETVKPAQARGLSALQVDSFEVKYYRRVNSSIRCTCSTSSAPAFIDSNEVDQDPHNAPHTLVNTDMGGDEEIVIDHTDNIFGTSNTTGFHEDGLRDPQTGGHTPYDEEILEDDDLRSQEGLFALSTDCGVCYRNGLVPGYELYGHDRKVLATHCIEDVYGYNVDRVATPNTFNAIDEREGYVDFVVEVPKYWQSVRYSVRNNGDHLADEPLYAPIDGQMVMTEQMLRYSSGRTAVIRVRAPQFTHVSIEFDLGTEPVLAALAQDSKATDWTLFDMLGTLSIVLPNSIAQVETSDVIYVPKRGYTFKVSDVTYLRTANNRNLDWQVQARVLQPQEALKRIYQSTRMR
jgi:hypothetical protein